MSKTAGIRALAVLAAIGCTWVALTQQNQPAGLTIEKVKDDLHVIVGSGGNVAVLTSDEGVALVDDKFERNVPEILDKVKTLTDRPIKYILNTHQHGDHTGGNQRLMASAEIIAHRNARANMVKGNQPGLPRIVFATEAALFVGGKEVRAHYFGRGHTNGDAIIHFPAHRVIHTGDMFVAGAPFIDYSAGGSGLAWTQTIDEALKLDFDTVIPGHGPVMKRDKLVEWKQSFETARKRITELRRQGKSRDEAAGLLKMDDLPGWSSSKSWTERSFPGLWDELGR